MDKDKLIEVEAQKREAVMDGINETRQKLKTRIEETEQRKQLLEEKKE